jgi:hypothetical protein
LTLLNIELGDFSETVASYLNSIKSQETVNFKVWLSLQALLANEKLPNLEAAQVGTKYAPYNVLQRLRTRERETMRRHAQVRAIYFVNLSCCLNYAFIYRVCETLQWFGVHYIIHLVNCSRTCLALQLLQMFSGPAFTAL